MNSRYKILLKDTVIFAIGSLGSKVILFFLVPLYTNFLSTAEYGTADLVTTLVTLIFPITGLSIERAVIRFGMKANEKKENVLKVSFIVLLFSFVITFALIPVFGLYKPVSNWKYYLAALVILYNITEVERAYLKVKNKNKAYSLIGILQTGVLAGSNIILLTLLKTGIQGYLLSNILALSVSAMVLFFVSEMHHDFWKGRYNSALLKKMVAYSAPLIFSGISWWIMHSSDKVMIEWIVGASALGLYTAATKIPSLINVITGIFNQAWTISSIREIESTKDDTFYSKTFDYHCAVLFGAGVIIISIVKPAMSIYVGADFRTSWEYTPFLLVSAMYYSIFAFCGTLYAALQRSVNDMWTSIIASIMNIVINYIFILKLGVWGAIIGTVSSFFVFSVVRIIDIKRYIDFNIDVFRFMFNSIIVFGLASSVTWQFYPIIVSIISIVAYFIVNVKYLKTFVHLIPKINHK